MISNEEINICKADLLARQTELIDQIQGHFDLSNAMVKESLGELSSYDNHPADMGTQLFERGKDIALNEHAEKELEEINEALYAIEEGTYGICSECGADIPFERLQAIPTTDRCIEHAKSDIFKHNRPIEEQVFSPNINPDEETAEVDNGYDAEDTWQEVSSWGTSETPSDFYGDRDNYNEMYPNSDENVGSVEDLEGFLAADQYGKFIGVTPNHNRYEDDYEGDQEYEE